MATCSSCGSVIIFGGIKDGKLRFCNEKCRSAGTLMYYAQNVPDDAALDAAKDILQGDCPICSGAGPVDFHTSHSIWSVVYFTSFKSTPVLCCRRCGRKNAIKSSAFSALFGWWGIPFGMIMTPIQLGRNCYAILSPPKLQEPSKELLEYVKLDIAHFALTEPDDKENEPASP